jgi:hypothetical protein
MLPPVIYLYPLNTQVVQVTELQDEVTGQFLVSASVTATLFDRRGNPDPVFNNIAMSYVPGSDATYQGVVPATFNAAIGGGYTLVLTAVQSGVQAQFSIPVIVQLRKNQ